MLNYCIRFTFATGVTVPLGMRLRTALAFRSYAYQQNSQLTLFLDINKITQFRKTRACFVEDNLRSNLKPIHRFYTAGSPAHE
jgi:hypothetical protein